MGSWAAELLSLYGGKVIAVTDRTGGIYSAAGIDILSLKRHMKAKAPFGGHLRSFPGGERSFGSLIWVCMKPCSLDCQVLLAYR